MRTQRKIQLGAVAVIANAIAALHLMTPNVASAAACTPGGGLLCDYTGACFSGNAILACTALAPPGCTVVQGACLNILCGPVYPYTRVICQWQ